VTIPQFRRTTIRIPLIHSIVDIPIPSGRFVQEERTEFLAYEIWLKLSALLSQTPNRMIRSLF